MEKVEVLNLKWEVTDNIYNHTSSGSSQQYRNYPISSALSLVNINRSLNTIEDMKFETGKTLGLPCTWHFRLIKPLQAQTIHGVIKRMTYEMDFELVDCPLNVPSVLAAFQIHASNNECERLEIEKREWKKGQPHVFLLNVDFTSRKNLELNLRFEMSSTGNNSSIHNDPERIMKEAQLLVEKKVKKEILDGNLNLLEQEDNFSDFVIKVMDTGKEFAVHKVILATRSPVFRTMFNSGMKEAKNGIMEIDDMSTKAVELLLKFIYSGTMSEEWTSDLIDVDIELIFAAHKYEIKILTEFCDKMLIHICWAFNAIELLKLARKFKLKTAEKDIKAWMSQNMTVEDVLNNYVLEYEEAS